MSMSAIAKSALLVALPALYLCLYLMAEFAPVMKPALVLAMGYAMTVGCILAFLAGCKLFAWLEKKFEWLEKQL